MKSPVTTLFLSLLLFSACEVIEDVLPGGIQYEESIQYISFCPEEGATTGLIYYPGALVPPESYNAWMEELSRQGYCAVTAKMPLNLAFFDFQAASKIRNKFPEVDRWVIGGHSLGGAMAAQLISNNLMTGAYAGLVLTGSYPSVDITDYDGRILSLYGSNDEISTVEEIDAGRGLMPEGTDITSIPEFNASDRVYYHLIEGGNHAQFGNYGIQQGDGDATITAEAQQAEVVAYISAFFESAGW
jgi:dienelactone hydrolase